MSTPAGWYPDPYDASKLRYWDGSVWTESVTEPVPPQPLTGPPTAPPTGPPTGSGAEQAPPFGSGPGGASWQPGPADWGTGTGYGDLGQWFGATFEQVGRRLVPLLVLLVGVPIVGVVAVTVLVGAVVRDVSIDLVNDDVSVRNVDTGLAVVAGLVAVAAVLVAIGGWLGANHQLYTAHLDRPAPVGRSLAVGIRRLPRTIGWALVGVVAYLLAAVAFVALIALVADVAPILLLIALPAAFAAGIWIYIRLSFVGVALAVGPSGTNPFAASWAVTRARWWSTLGRLLLLVVIVAIGGVILNAVASALTVPGLADGVTFSADGDLLIDGVPIDDLDSIDVADLLPGIGGLAAVAVVSVITQAIQQVVVLSGLAGLYVRGGGSGEV